MKAFLLFSVFFAVALLTLSDDSGESYLSELHIGPDMKYYDSDGDEILFPSGKESLRVIRRHYACRYPKKMVDSQLDCRLYPSSIECNQTCMFGHTFKEGNSRRMRCDYKEDKWHPVPTFERCKPFVDCTLTLGPGGKYNCHSNYMDKGPICTVSCVHYEDKPAVPPTTYECDIQGKWHPELPFCATPGSGIRLLPPPQGLMTRFTS